MLESASDSLAPWWKRVRKRQGKKELREVEEVKDGKESVGGDGGDLSQAMVARF